MLHSTVTSKGQTTIPRKFERPCELNRATSWNTKVEGDRAIIRVHPAFGRFKGALASTGGRDGLR